MPLVRRGRKGWKTAKQARAEAAKANNPTVFKQRKQAARRRKATK